jgi:hypothetical protein
VKLWVGLPIYCMLNPPTWPFMCRLSGKAVFSFIWIKKEKQRDHRYLLAVGPNQGWCSEFYGRHPLEFTMTSVHFKCQLNSKQSCAAWHPLVSLLSPTMPRASKDPTSALSQACSASPSTWPIQKPKIPLIRWDGEFSYRTTKLLD